VSLLTFSPIDIPKVDIGTISFNSKIIPADQIRIMSDTEFEQFASEWLYGCKYEQYNRIVRIGGAGDMGRDIIASYSNSDIDYYQCKHYANSLAPSDVYIEFGKLCYYTYTCEIPISKSYFIIPSNGIGPSLQKLIDTPSSINNTLIENWEKHCQTKITKTTPILLDVAFKNYITNFDFSIIKYYPIERILDEHLKTKYGYFRFGSQKIERPSQINVPQEHEDIELTYIKELFSVYSETIRYKISSISDLTSFARYLNHFQNQRKSFFAAETIRRFVRDTFSDNDEFDVLKEEVYEGILEICLQDYDNGFERLTTTLQAATQISTSKSLLDSKLHYVGNTERKGICHMLVNDKKIKWVTDDGENF